MLFMLSLRVQASVAAAQLERSVAFGGCKTDHHPYNGMMNWINFNIGFWHPFGPHGREGRDEILQRKAHEITTTGWTLWSFQYRKPETVQPWLDEIAKVQPASVFVLCSDSPNARDATGAVKYCTRYQPLNSDTWFPFPDTIRIPHPLGSRDKATAFVVKSIIQPGQIHEQPLFTVQWFSKGTWRDDPLPTRGEFLISPSGQAKLRRVYAVLELKHPYIVSITG